MYSTLGLVPGTLDFGLSENKNLQRLFPWLAQVNNPDVNPTRAQPWSTSGYTGQQSTTYQPGPSAVSPVQTQSFGPSGNVLGDSTGASNGGRASISAPAQNNGGFNWIAQAANEAYNNALRQAQQNYDLGRGIYQQGMDTLNTRRGQFKQMFDDTSSDILTGYEKNRGEAQRSAAGEETRSANALRALGLGGSAVIRSQGRQAQENARTLGSLQEGRTRSDRENASNLSEQNLWANNQESELNTYLKGLENKKQSIESGAGTDFQNILGQIGNNLASLRAAQTGVNSFEASPIDITSFLNANTTPVNPNIGSLGTVGTTQPDNTQVSLQNDPSIWYKKLLGIQ